ncbi:hypothetical protein QNH46_16275 [Paenibacillus woosongensis]|uniref:DUF5668 domain-containing protein n=2 Tax=Paenibacillus TaxID=44249 RepID=A0AA95KSK2_9BACL|nr:hypothetical protein [Paenibacillus woosongensis]WHX47693.1 hypothetical protein QNH46_16275 [Paenibacillus woosongensis]GIP57766.1 hypothetical protein J15TS10_15800 [Paenibacillus woosongensis]
MSDNNKLMTGILILAAGVIILLGKWGVFSFLGKALWPLILLVPGILLHIWVISRRASAELLLPAGILVIYSILFFIGIIGGWTFLFYRLWPAFILGIAVGLFEYYAYSPQRQSGMLLMAIVLAAASIFLLGWSLFAFSFVYLLAIIMIAAGIWLIVNRGDSRRIW